MKFFLDENFPKAGEDLLLSRGHSVVDIRGTNAEGACDNEIFERAQRERAVFLSTDRDFFHTIPHLYPKHFGIVVIALRQPNRKKILSRLSWFLDHYKEEPLAGKAYLLRDRTYSIFTYDN